MRRRQYIQEQAQQSYRDRTEYLMDTDPRIAYAEERAEQIIEDAKRQAEEILKPHECVCGKRFKNAAGLGSHRVTCKEYQDGLNT